MTYTKQYRRNLELFWRQFYPNWTIPKGYHVHHIKPRCTFRDRDDPKIDHPSNLIALHPDDHYTIHKLRGDKRVRKSFIVNVVGRKMTQDEKDEISKRSKGTGNPFYGKKHSDETKLKMSESSIGKGKGKIVSDETKMKLSNDKKGKKRKPFTAEHKARISVAMAGRKCKPFTDEHKANMSASKKIKKIAEDNKKLLD